MLLSMGEILPPCGTPSSPTFTLPFSNTPALRNRFTRTAHRVVHPVIRGAAQAEPLAGNVAARQLCGRFVIHAHMAVQIEIARLIGVVFHPGSCEFLHPCHFGSSQTCANPVSRKSPQIPVGVRKSELLDRESLAGFIGRWGLAHERILTSCSLACSTRPMR